MATCDSTAIQDGFFEYHERCWGDVIYGTKDVLQSMGVGVGLAFPGEAGGPKRELNTTDPRGFECRITVSHHQGAGVYCASIRFPDREPPNLLGGWKHFASGVQRKANYWTDDFVGTADDLISAGLVPQGYFPGCPGMRKVTVTILPDGSIPNGAPTSKHPDSRKPGAKSVTRMPGMKFCVSLYIDKELGELRSQAVKEARDEWERKMVALPRPPRIDGKPTQPLIGAKQSVQPLTIADWKNSQMVFFDVLRAKVEDHPWLDELNSHFKYDAASRMKILAKLNELEQSINTAIVLHKAPLGQTNNVNVISIR